MNIIVSSRGQSGRGQNAGRQFRRRRTWNRRDFRASTVNAVLAGQNAFFIETDVAQQSFLTKWSADGSRMIFSTFLDNQETVVASDAAGNTYVAGLALTKFSPGGDLLFTLPLDALSASAMFVDSSGDLYLAASPTNGAGGCGAAPTIMKFDPQGNLIFSNTVPQTCGQVFSMAVDTSGAIYLAGITFSASLATTATAIEPLAPKNFQLGFSRRPYAAGGPGDLSQLRRKFGPRAGSFDNSGNVYRRPGLLLTRCPSTPATTFAGSACSKLPRKSATS